MEIEAAKFFDQKQSRISELVENERGQTRVRLGVLIFLALYFFPSGYHLHPLFFTFLIYSVVLYLLAKYRPGYYPRRYLLAIFLDTSTCIGALYIAEDAATFVFICLIQVGFGAGARYGLNYLNFSVALALIGLLFLYMFSPYWSQQQRWIFTFAVGVPFIAYYVRSLVEAIRQAKSAALKREFAMRRLTANVSHEIRTPLHALLTITELLQQDSEQEVQIKRAQLLKDGVESLARIVTNILDYSKIETGSFIELAEDKDVCEIIGNACRLYEDEIRRINLQFSLHINPELPRCAKLDSLRIEQIIRNMLANATRFTTEGSIRVIASVEGKNNMNKMLTVTVKDTGIGITKEQEGELFEIASHNSTSPQSWYGGSGLGMALSRELARAMSGDLVLLQMPGVGATFKLSVPLHLSHASKSSLVIDDRNVILVTRDQELGDYFCALLDLDTLPVFDVTGVIEHLNTCNWNYGHSILFVDDAVTNSSDYFLLQSIRHDIAQHSILLCNHDPIIPNDLLETPYLALLPRRPEKTAVQNTIAAHTYFYGTHNASKLGEDSRIHPVLSNKTILIVDDNRTNREITGDVLKIAGANVIQASNGVHAIQALNRFRCDCVILDFQMPLLNGLETLVELRKSYSREEIPIIIFTAAQIDVPTERLLAIGANGYLQQPINPRELITCIKSIISNGSWASDERTLKISQATKVPVIDISFYDSLRNKGVENKRIVELLTVFQADAWRKICDVRDSLEKNSAEKTSKAAHALKGICYTAGAVRLANVADTFLDRDLCASSEALKDRLFALNAVWEETRASCLQYCEHLDVEDG